jgi:hypothetical protein
MVATSLDCDDEYGSRLLAKLLQAGLLPTLYKQYLTKIMLTVFEKNSGTQKLFLGNKL